MVADIALKPAPTDSYAAWRTIQTTVVAHIARESGTAVVAHDDDGGGD